MRNSRQGMVKLRTWIYKRSHCGDPNPRTGIFGCGDCGHSQRGRQYDNVIGVWGSSNWEADKQKATKLSWVGIKAHRLEKNTVKELEPLFKKWWKPEEGQWTSEAPLLAFEHFLYYKNGYDLLEKARNLVTYLAEGNPPGHHPLRTGGVFSDSVRLPREAQEELDPILDLASPASQSQYLPNLDYINQNFQHLDRSTKERLVKELLEKDHICN